MCIVSNMYRVGKVRIEYVIVSAADRIVAALSCLWQTLSHKQWISANVGGYLKLWNHALWDLLRNVHSFVIYAYHPYKLFVAKVVVIANAVIVCIPNHFCNISIVIAVL